jgi:hypothetical protein
MPLNINEDELVPVKGRISGAGTGYILDGPGRVIVTDAGVAGADTAYTFPALETAATFAEIVAGGSPRFIYVVEDENDADNPGLYFFNGTSYFALTMTLYVPE